MMEMMKFVMARPVSQDQVKNSKNSKKVNILQKNSKLYKKFQKIFLGDGGCILDPNSVNTGTHNTAFTVRLFWVEN